MAEPVFRSLTPADLPLPAGWLAAAHVRRRWGAPESTLCEIRGDIAAPHRVTDPEPETLAAPAACSRAGFSLVDRRTSEIGGDVQLMASASP